MAWKVRPHLCTHAMGLPALLAGFSGDDAAGMEMFADMGMVEFAVELGIGQDETDGADALGGVEERAKSGAVVGGTGVSPLGEHELPVEVDHHQPLQPLAPRHRLLRVVVHATHEAGADRALAQAGGIDRHPSPATWARQRNAMHHLVESAGDGRLVQAANKAVQGGVIGGRTQLQSTPQFDVFAQADLGFAIGPVFVTHEAQNRQQLRLRELVFAELGSIARHRRLCDIQSDACELHQTDFGHGQCGFSRSSRRE